MLGRLLRGRSAGASTGGRAPSVREVLDAALSAEDQYAMTGDPALLDGVLGIRREVLANPAVHEHPALLAEVLNGVGTALLRRWWATGSERDLQDGIAELERAVEAIPPDDEELPGILTNLGAALRDRYALSGEPDDLERMLERLRRAVDSTPADSPSRALRLGNLGGGLRDRFVRLGDGQDLEQAIDAFEEARRLTALDSPDLPLRLGNLGTALLNRYELRGTHEDLDAAVAAHERAIEAAPANSPNLPALAHGLAGALATRFRLGGDVADLDRAVEVQQRATAGTPAPAQFAPNLVTSLGMLLLERYSVAGGAATLNDAIESLQHGVDLSPAGSVILPAALTALSGALLQSYELTGSREDLDRALAAQELALAGRSATSSDGAISATADSPGWATAQGAHAGGLHQRYRYTGDLTDLDEAIAISAEAVSATPPGSASLPSLLTTAGNALWERHRRTADPEDLESALRTYRQALELTPSGSPVRPRRLKNLGAALRARFGTLGDPDDLERAVEAYEEAIEQSPPGSPDLVEMLSGLGTGLWDRYEHGGGRDDLERCLDAHTRAVEESPDGSPALAGRLSNLGNAASALHGLDGGRMELEQGRDAYRNACRRGIELDPIASLGAAHNWGGWASAREAWAEAAEAYAYGLDAVDQLFQTQVLRRHKETWLRQARGMSERAATALARNGDLRGAALALERGRAVLLTEALERDRADLDGLREFGHEDLADRYEAAAGHWNDLAHAELRGPSSPLASHDAPAGLRRARDELDQAIAAVREVAGYERFLDPPRLEDIEAAASSTPLVYVVAADPGGLALVATRSAVSEIRLPELRADALRREAERYLTGYAQRRDDPRLWSEALDQATRWLWDVLIGPLVDGLGATPRATLVPIGLLGLLPLHAAWTDDAGRPGGRRYALDELALTYAPNARALSAAERIAGQIQPDGLLAVEDPRPVAAGPLPGAVGEVASALARFPRTHRLDGERATRRAVLDALEEYPVLHFACHGFADIAEPLESALLMAGDELLSLREILAGTRAGARLAVLSACETAVPGADLPDEVVSLPTALLQAGVGGVVGSLWAVSDASTTVLMARFYELWREEGLDPPEALRRAQQWVRDASNAEKRDRFPGIEALSGARVPAKARALWEQGHAHRSPQHWSSFTYVGA